MNFVHGAFALEEDLALIEQLEAVRPTVVVVDPMVSYFRGDENSSEDMSRFLRHVTLARDVGASVIVLLTTPARGDDEGQFKERGSSAPPRLGGPRDEAGAPASAGSSDHPPREESGARHPPAQMRWVFEESTSWIKLVDEASAPSSKSLASMKLVGRILAETRGCRRDAPEGARGGPRGEQAGPRRVVEGGARRRSGHRSERLVTNTRGAQVKGVFYRLTSAVHAAETGSSVHATTPASTRGNR